MDIARFEFTDGARLQPGAPRDANIVGRRLEELRARHNGEITAELVVEDAAHPSSPLHPFFEWDDSAAAREFRLNQARTMIRTVVAVYVNNNQPEVRHRAYVHIADPEKPHYRETSHALSVKSTRDPVIRQALRDLQNWKKRYGDLREFANLIPVITLTIDEIEQKLVE